MPVASAVHSRTESRTAPEFPVHRAITVHVTGGFDGSLRVLVMLRGRRYRVRDLAVEVYEGVVQSRIDCTITLSAAETRLLLERLRRIPVVVTADTV